jgi:trigger factor
VKPAVVLVNMPYGILERPSLALGSLQGALARAGIKTRSLYPHLEFARLVGEGFPSLQALRSRVADDLKEALERDAEHRYHDAALDALVERAGLDYPEVMIDREVERLLQEQSGAGTAPGRRRGAGREELERYLQRIGRSEEEIRAELQPMAQRRVCRSLVLSQLGEAEHIDVTDDEVAAEIERLASGAGNQADELRRLISSDSARESLKRSLVTRKTLDRLVEIASAGGVASEEAQASAGRQG